MDITKNKNGVLDSIVYLMEQVESFIDFSGQQKENYVLNQLKTLLGNEAFERYHPIFPLIIKFLVLISKQQIKLNLNRLKIKKFSCFR